MFLVPDKESIAKRRKEQGLSMHGLSMKAQLSSAAILRIESGTTLRINHLRAESIARALGCKVEDICEIPAGKKVG